jgi:hypothetical protein
MTENDVEKERQRLRALYATMEDGELAGLAAEAESLTDIAREVLFGEFKKRGLRLAGLPSPPPTTPRDAAPPVLIRRYRDLPEATIAKSILDSAGVESFLGDDNIVRLDWFYSNLVGGVKLLVRPEDAEAARKLLQESVPETFEAGETGTFQQPRCPRCQSFDVSFDGLDRRFSYASLFVIPIPLINKGWKCTSCGYAWTEEENPPSAAAPET